jgi:general secretion pathway protein G
MREHTAKSVEHGAGSGDLAQGFSAPVGISLLCSRYSPPVTRHSTRRAGAFTLIELLAVVAIIAILAALTLSTLGYVNKKGAESRARSEVAALSAAIEAFKLDTGAYPTNLANPYTNSLYTNLCPPTAGAKVYFEPTPGILGTNGGTVQFFDPWGTAYGYSNAITYFDLWSTAGGSANTNEWIRN